MALPPEFLEELRARTPMQALVGRRVKLTQGRPQLDGLLPLPQREDAELLRLRGPFPLLRLRRAWRRDQLRHADQRRRLSRSGGEPGGRGRARGPQALRPRRAGRAAAPRPAWRARARPGQLRPPPACAGRARPGLAYLRGRGLSDATIARFGLGWSGDGRGALIAELRQAGVDAGARARGRPAARDRGRRAARAVLGPHHLPDPRPPRPADQLRRPRARRRQAEIHQRPGHPGLSQAPHPLCARPGARRRAQGERMIVAEGYMDVIALHQAGFTGAVAPLGTALTARAARRTLAAVARAGALLRRRRRRRRARPNGRSCWRCRISRRGTA